MADDVREGITILDDALTVADSYTGRRAFPLAGRLAAQERACKPMRSHGYAVRSSHIDCHDVIATSLIPTVDTSN